MQPRVRVLEVYKTRPDANPRSGRAFEEYGDVIGYEVYGPFGVIMMCRTEKKALQMQAEYQEFYDKFFPPPKETPNG